MSIACVLLNYNDSDRINNLVFKLLEYEIFDFIVVSDNNSKDKENLKDFNGRVKNVFNKENKGYAAGNNEAFRYLKNKGIDYVFTINSDIEISKDNILLMLDFLKKHDKCAACSIRMKYKNKFIQNYFQLETTFNTITRIQDIPFLAKFNKHKDYFETGYVRESCVLYDYNKFEEIGFYDEDFFLFEEGPTSALNFKKKGYYEAIVGTKSNFYIHNHKGELMSKNMFKFYKESKIKYFKKYLNASKFSIWIIETFW